MRIDLSRLEALARKATAGPWRWGVSGNERNGLPESMFKLYAGDERALPVIVLQPEACWLVLNDDTELIAAASPDVILALVRVAKAACALDDDDLHPGRRETTSELLAAIAALEK